MDILKYTPAQVASKMFFCLKSLWRHTKSLLLVTPLGNCDIHGVDMLGSKGLLKRKVKDFVTGCANLTDYHEILVQRLLRHLEKKKKNVRGISIFRKRSLAVDST